MTLDNVTKTYNDSLVPAKTFKKDPSLKIIMWQLIIMIGLCLHNETQIIEKKYSDLLKIVNAEYYGQYCNPDYERYYLDYDTFMQAKH